MNNFSIYMLGVVLIVAALGYGAYLLGATPLWIGIGAVILLGMGLMGAAKKAGLQSDDSDGPPRR